ncbi:lecithin:cholesterol acyltransferase [Capsaspora owczarzaki ATCC 30864]|uniref:Lecithin:cholesterol acyltransferase n=1 Tax=Capsaspora owczarzaki (strain ATCC 30864) TaxID=595528 RepID=A0A0D2U4E7_CAPO3|nr:lecithin:cholesterol acyltransferase [Capsaspora owczarzaki ATCC 30864]KJE90036.1 lecithin:cholesterol acyltransferase [Capsaspora owczarzaki ATCC 30864]|eukprot:XP_004349935.1 lecithin:cholesterol acyltransferase [Capsaspora owczarzaki ATCC 30864]
MTRTTSAVLLALALALCWMTAGAAPTPATANTNTNDDATAESATSYDACANPIVLVTGLGGCVLDFLLTDEYKHLHYECSLVFSRNKWSSGLVRLWPAIEAVDAIPPYHLRACWEDMMAVHYNETTGRFANTPGVQVRPRDYGGVTGVDNLFDIESNWGPGMSAVYEKLIKQLKVTPGYEVGKNIRGAPFDFRLVADDIELASMFTDLKNLIEETYNMTRACSAGPRRVHVMTHSLGGSYWLYFLNTFVDRAWKDQYIRFTLAVSSPWQGAGKAYRTLISGDDEGLPGGNIMFLPVEQLMGGLLWMIPFSNFFGTKTFIQYADTGASFSSNASDVARLFDSMPGTLRPLVPFIISKIVEPRSLTVAAPETDIYCIHGSGVVTESFYVYQSANQTNTNPAEYREDAVINGTTYLAPNPALLFPLDKSSPFYVDPNQGDGTVELPSLQYCRNWIGKNGGKQMVEVDVAGQEHLGILSSAAFLNDVMPLILAP